MKYNFFAKNLCGQFNYLKKKYEELRNFVNIYSSIIEKGSRIEFLNIQQNKLKNIITNEILKLKSEEIEKKEERQVVQCVCVSLYYQTFKNVCIKCFFLRMVFKQIYI